jgi:ABC-2 type transport system permease protein
VLVLVGSEFKLKYAGSLLGYAWSLAKPLALFSMMYVVFGLLVHFASYRQYPLYLLLGLILFTFFSEATNTAKASIIQRASLVQKLPFPRLIIPVSATLTAGLTFALNSLVVTAFVASNRIVPGLDWLLLVPLLVELYAFTLGISLILAALNVRFRDIGQIWDLVLQLLLYGSGVFYPLQEVPLWGQKLVLVNPLAQVIQDARSVVLTSDVDTISTAYGTAAARLIPLGIVAVVLVLGFALFKREEPWFAERVA